MVPEFRVLCGMPAYLLQRPRGLFPSDTVSNGSFEDEYKYNKTFRKAFNKNVARKFETMSLPKICVWWPYFLLCHPVYKNDPRSWWTSHVLCSGSRESCRQAHRTLANILYLHAYPIMDYSVAKLFFKLGKVGINEYYTDKVARTNLVSTQNMLKRLIQLCLGRWRSLRRLQFPLGSVKLGCADIKTFFLSFWRAWSNCTFMAYRFPLACPFSYYGLLLLSSDPCFPFGRERRRAFHPRNVWKGLGSKLQRTCFDHC